MSNLTKDKGKAPMYENITGDDDPPSAGVHCGSSSILSEQFVRMNLIDASNHFCGEDQQGSSRNFVFESQDGSRYWTPNVTSADKHAVGMVFANWFDACKFYSSYAEKSRFSTRIGPMKKWNGTTTHRYLLCAKAGKPKDQNFDTLDMCKMEYVRARTFKVSDCKARLKLKAVTGCSSFVVYDFLESHNHELVSAKNADLTRRGVLLKTVYGIANMYALDNSDMSAKRNDIREMKVEVFENYPVEGCSNSKSAVICELVGDVNHSDVPFTAPIGIKNKRSGTKKRHFIGLGERAAVSRKKPGRKCQKCLGIGDHDSRNCPLNEDVDSP
ncbi:hypothetical protein L1987_21316 [Smallanthus sonchifolius]|uniref:Uncharacterized protein n=1 Tax=Smallanthus sonchifolius TaxID=185202 RepID=A0ACB9IUB2_9ASTR|nr:hypothetical protein L1987_21316 [Smallanthus sonchifolius]